MAIDPHHRPEPQPSGGITVIGTGRAVAAVDRATVTVGVEVVRADAGEAFRVAGGAVAAVLAVLDEQGIGPRDARTADVTLGPRFDFAGGAQTLVGYQAAQRIVVTVGDVSRLGPLLTALAGSAEGVRVDGVAFAVAGMRELESDARTAAMVDAREKAMSLAALAGRPLGPVAAVEESERDPAPRAIALATHTAGGTAMPVALGDAAVTVSVRVRFGWAD